jgi:hypothetical protein
MSQILQKPDTSPLPPPDDEEPVDPSPQKISRLPWIYRVIDRLALADHRALLVRTGIALVMMVGLALLSPSFFGWGLAVAATIVAVPISRLRAPTRQPSCPTAAPG